MPAPAVYAAILAGTTVATRYGPQLQTVARNLQARGAVLVPRVNQFVTETLIADGATIPYSASKLPQRAQVVKDAVKSMSAAAPEGTVTVRDLHGVIKP
jgi:hypothetical protein